MVDIIPFDEAMKRTDGQRRGLLLGNGFSIKYFSYRNLLEVAGLSNDDALRALFVALDTVDFESVMRALEDAAIVEGAYKNEKQSELFLTDADRLRKALVHAIRATHPANRDSIADVIPSCIAFLKNFESIFTLNYDLLLYWVRLADTNAFRDGFGLGKEENGFIGPFKIDAHCNIFNLHGGLHLFRTAIGDVEKRVMTPNGVLDAITETITNGKRMPIYVAEGKSSAKLRRINSTPYLKHCYNRLGESSGPFFVFGHSAALNDAHIYLALFKSKIEHLYFCIHKASTKIEQIDGELARYKRLAKSAIEYTFVDSESAHVWDGLVKK